MSAKRLSLVLSVALAASPGLALADGHAHSSRGSGHGGGHGNGNGGGHPSSGGSHAVPRSQGSGGSGPQYRHPQPGTRTGYRYGGRGYRYGYGRGYYPYYPYYGYGYGYPYWGWGGSIGLYYGGGYPYYSYPYSYDDGYYSADGYSGSGYRAQPRAAGAVRLLVDPEDAKVYVDGYYSGTVDDYDGLGQRLYLPAGTHEITLRLDGYQAQRFKVYVTPDNTLKIHFTMVKGTGEAPQDVVVGDPSAEQYARDSRRDDDRERHDSADRDADRPPARRSGDDRYRMDVAPPRDGGPALRLSVKPADASVYVDGRFYGTARQASRLELSPGRHRIEVVRPGYHTYDNEVEVGLDAPTDLDVTLER